MIKSDDELIWSPIVVNSRMNRSRTSSGINSYEKEFGFKPEDFLSNILHTKANASWLDICCGEGKALTNCGRFFKQENKNQRIQFIGIDLIDAFAESEPELDFITFKAGSINDIDLVGKFDLITCVHGLHYIGDKLGTIEKAINHLNENGLFIANLDLANLKIENEHAKNYFQKLFKQIGIQYNSRSRILKYIGKTKVRFTLEFVGADDAYGPNYTGQESVLSYYKYI